jgi:hypothetical protein
VFAYRYRAHLPPLRWIVLTLGLAFVCFAAMVVLDWYDLNPTLEDSLKTVAGALILSAFLSAYFELAPEKPET